MTSENAARPVEEKNEAGGSKKSTVVDALFDIGLSWAEFSVGQGKRVLETSAKTIQRVAHTLDDLEKKLRKDASA